MELDQIKAAWRCRPTRCFARKPTPQTPSTTPLEVACPDVPFPRRP